MDSRSHDLLETPAFPEVPFSIFLKTPNLLEQSYPRDFSVTMEMLFFICSIQNSH